MDIKLFLLSITCIIIGAIIMIKHKFYKYPMNDILFATKLQVFLGGLFFFIIGTYGALNEIILFTK